MEHLFLFLEQLLFLGGVEGRRNPLRFPVHSCMQSKGGGSGKLHSNKFQVLFSKCYDGYESFIPRKLLMSHRHYILVHFTDYDSVILQQNNLQCLPSPASVRNNTEMCSKSLKFDKLQHVVQSLIRMLCSFFIFDKPQQLVEITSMPNCPKQ